LDRHTEMFMFSTQGYTAPTHSIFSDYQRNFTDPQAYMSSTYIGDGVKRAIWQMVLALLFKGVITVFTFGMKVTCL